MININTIISNFDEEGTLLKWLKKVEDALKNASLKTVETVTIDDTSFQLKFVFADDTFLLSPTIKSPKGVFDALAGKLDANKNAIATVGGLVSPSQAPSVIEFVGIDSTGAQVLIQVDTNDFEIDGSTSPYTLKKKQATDGKTWFLNKELTINETATYNVNFISNGMAFNSLRMEAGKLKNLYYGSELAFAKDPVGGATWYDNNFRTVNFITSPTGDLLAWLEENGVKQ